MKTVRCKTSSQMDNRDDDKDCLEVFCRLRPTGSDEELVCLKTVDNQTVSLMSSKTSGVNRSGGIKETLYSFSEVFSEKVSQKEIFKRTALPLVKDLIFGGSGVLFTYGTTSSGKTQTMIGTPEDCGILPRCLDVIFNSITDHQTVRYVFKSDKLNNFYIQNEEEAALDQRKENNLDRGTARPKKKDQILDWSRRKRTTSKIDLSATEMRYSVFVSYVEIYNNFIYDLLEDPSALSRPKPFASKMIREDSSRKTYIFGVNEVEVKVADEAFDMIQKGQLYRRVSNTVLNSASSRSHLVFTIRVVQAPLQALESVTAGTKLQLCVSQLSLVDLAGSERLVRTGNTGDRLRETGNINSSLIALRNCIETMRESQTQGLSKVVPYRQSKLTYLFKAFFEGEGKIKMIICLNPRASDRDEIKHVLKFAELTQEVLVNRSTPVPTYSTDPFENDDKEQQKSRMKYPEIDEERERRKSGEKYGEIDDKPASSHSMTVLNPAGTATHGESVKRKERKTIRGLKEDPYPFIPSTNAEISRLLDHDPSYEETLSDLIQAKECFKRRRQMLKNDLSIKQSQFRENLIGLDKEISSLRQQNAYLKMDLNGREEQVKNLEKDLCKVEQTVIFQEKKIETLENAVRILQFEMREKEAQIESCRVDKENLKKDMERKMVAEKERMRKNMEQKFLQKQSEFEKKAKVTKRKVQLMREILNADELQGDDDGNAVDDDLFSRNLRYIYSSERRYKKRSQMNDKGNTEKAIHRKNSELSVEGKSRSCKSLVECTRSGNPPELGGKKEASDVVESKIRPLRLPSSLKKGSRLLTKSASHSLSNLGDFVSLTRYIAVANPRHRRSHSTDKDLWVEHKPLSNLELDTVLQPVMKRKKSVNKLVASDITKDVSKYVLEHQEQNSEGEVETQFYKADVIPSQSGGAQVIFKDVEKLKQVSPPNRYSPKKNSNFRTLPREEIKENCALSCENHGLPHRF